MLNYFSKKSGQKECIYLARNTDGVKVTGEKKSENLNPRIFSNDRISLDKSFAVPLSDMGHIIEHQSLSSPETQPLGYALALQMHS